MIFELNNRLTPGPPFITKVPNANGLEPDEKPSYSVSHLDPSHLSHYNVTQAPNKTDAL